MIQVSENICDCQVCPLVLTLKPNLHIFLCSFQSIWLLIFKVPNQSLFCLLHLSKHQTKPEALCLTFCNVIWGHQVVNMKIMVIFNMMLCTLVEWFQDFEGICCLYHQARTLFYSEEEKYVIYWGKYSALLQNYITCGTYFSATLTKSDISLIKTKNTWVRL